MPHRNGELHQMVRALHSPRIFPCGLNGREQQCDHYADDRNHGEKFKHCKGEAFHGRDCRLTV
jgi:hypothetical protein